MSLTRSRHNTMIICLDTNADHVNRNSLERIRNLIHSIEIFNNLDDFIRFVELITVEQIFLIINNSFDQQRTRLLHLIEETIQIESVYILSPDQSQTEQWKTDCPKFQGIFPQMESICQALERTISKTSIISTTDNDLNEIDQLYIYSKLLTEIIHRIEYNDQAKKDGFNLCREYHVDNANKLQEINEFEEYYQQHSPIWWYTKGTPIHILLRECFITQNFDLMIKLGFFIQDLHREIKKIYLDANQKNSFITYRGQGMSNEDFEKFLGKKDGLYAFHNIISTSTDEETGHHFAQGAAVNHLVTGVLFQIEINPLMFPTVFAVLDKSSYYGDRENEVLLSTHSIFRIGEMKQLDERLWKVNLLLPCDIDQQLHFLTDHIRNQIQGINIYHSLALFFHQIGRYSKAIEYFNEFLQQMSDDDQKEFMDILASTENSIALMHDLMGNHSCALTWYEKALEIQEKSSPPNHSSLAIVYNNIGMTHRAMGNYRKALTHCEKSLSIRLKCSSEDKIDLTMIYSNIGQIYESKGEYSTALSYYKKAYKIQKTSLTIDHPSMTLSYNNFGGIYTLIGQYSKALSSYEKTLEIQSKFLIPDHPSIAITYNNLGHVYQLLANYRMSLSYYEEAIRIQEKNALSNQLPLATTFNNIALVYRLIGDSSQALSYYEKSLMIEKTSLHPTHPSLASTHNNLGGLYQSIGEYLKALEYYRQAYEIWKTILPLHHPSIATLYNNIGCTYDSMGDQKKALSSYEDAIHILEKSTLANPLELAGVYNNLGELHRSMEDYPNALLNYQKTLEIEEKHLSSRHPSLAITLSNMAVALDANNESVDAFQYAQRAFDTSLNALGANDAQTKMIEEYLHQLRQKLTPNPT